MEREKSPSEMLNLCLQKLMEAYYDKMKGRFELCFYESRSQLKENGAAGHKEWRCLSGSAEDEEEIGKILLEGKAGGILAGRVLSKSRKVVLYCSDEVKVKDSGSLGGSSKTICWVFLGKEMKTSICLILKIVSEELLSRLDDLLFLELIKDKMDPGAWGNVSELGDDNLCLYFFGDLLEKDWLNRKYVKQALLNAALPDWTVFMRISAMSYEKRSIKTCLYFTDAERLSDKCAMKFRDDYERVTLSSTSDFRTIRKLTEIAGASHGLLISKAGYDIIGIIKRMDEADEPEIVCVEFLDYMVWELKSGKEILFKYQKGEYQLPELESEDDAEKEIRKLRECSLDGHIALLANKVRKMADHGTALIFMDKGALGLETKRLAGCHRAIPVKQFNLAEKAEQVKNIFSIDGAVLLDFECNCLAVGAIVDGKAYPADGGISRGARYNSIVSYVRGLKESTEEYRDTECLAIIFSEDGMVNVEKNFENKSPSYFHHHIHIKL